MGYVPPASQLNLRVCGLMMGGIALELGEDAWAGGWMLGWRMDGGMMEDGWMDGWRMDGCLGGWRMGGGWRMMGGGWMGGVERRGWGAVVSLFVFK